MVKEPVVRQFKSDFYYERRSYTFFHIVNKNNGWNYQYIVNNSGLTADQWKAVNSGISAEILDGLASKAYAEQVADQALADAKIYTDSIVGNIESAINTIRGVTA